MINNLHTEKQIYMECYQKFFGVTMRYCRNREDAMEVFNDSMVKVIKYVKEGKIKSESFYGWTKTVIIHTAIDFLRKKKMEIVEFDFSAEKACGMEGNSGEQTLLQADIMKQIQRLPEKTRMVFNLYVFEGYNHKEIAQELSITEGTSHWHVNNARKLVKQYLQQTSTVLL